MKRLGIGLFAVAACVVWAVMALSQPPGGPPPRFQPGQVLPPFVRDDLKLTKEQEKQIAELEKEVKERLDKILTDEQKKIIENARPPRGPGGPGGPPGGDRPQDNKDRPARPQVSAEEATKNLVKNPRFVKAGEDEKQPADYVLKGDVAWVVAGTKAEFTDRGVALYSNKKEGSVTQDVTGFEGGVGKWFRFTVRGLAENNFAVGKDELYLKVDFYAKKGTNYLDGVTRKIYPLVERDRKELAENGVRRKEGGAVWKTYAMEFKLPFAEIDQLRVDVGFRNGAAAGEKDAAFYVTQFELVPISDPADAPKVVKKEKGYEPSKKDLVALGGRWYYEPEQGWRDRPARLTVNYANAKRLYYMDSRLTNPFAENMTAWLRKGYKDLDGKVVDADRFIADNVVVEFADDKTMVVRARNIPNHPTAEFPERRGNPSFIQEHEYTYYLPLNPVRNAKAVAMDKNNSNRALPMGAIGIAINGVVFYNPFDAGMQDATDMMDRCCGHPSPDNRYHYHKYPVCVKSPFADEGEEHSPLIGWAFDGFPIYGPYEGKGVMAKDSKDNPLNEFNVHFDEVRGWHYHVTPGKYPYVIGGYWGEVDTRNFPRRGPCAAE
jgi:hypothetical protein